MTKVTGMSDFSIKKMIQIRYKDLVSTVASLNTPESQDAIKHIKSYQHQLGLKILGKRIQLHLTEKQAADKLNMPLKTYQTFENGTNQQASKQQYLQILHNLERK